MIRTAAIALIVLGGAAPVAAQTMTERASVKYGDLDLSRPAGRATLDRRLEAAVSTVCATGQGRRTLDEARWDEGCRTSAWAAARDQLAEITDGRVKLANATLVVTPGAPR